jgi:OmpA-OmpF porin, OOP family
MKKLLALLVFTAFAFVSFAQKGEYVKKPALGVNFILQDFKGADYVRLTSLSQAFRDKRFGKVKEMSAGLSLNYLEGLSNHLDLSVGLGGAFLDYPIPNRAAFGSDNLLLEADLSVNAKMFSDKYWISPYLTAGIGASKYKSSYGAFLPMGVGAQLNFFDEAFLLIGSQYRIPITDNTNYHFYHSIGIAGNLGKKRVPKPLPPPPPPPAPEPPKDADSDGIVDSLDACPSEAGLAAFQGCPDKDGDGIPDKNDKCADVAGLARYEGCPIPDTDKDGINDEEDKCKDVPGVARYQGCPIPDADNDGINDEEDKCPEIAGVAANNGCPEIKPEVIKKVEYAAKNIFFSTGKFSLLSKSFKPLNEVAKILAENPDLKLDIDGHTDNTGKADKNQALSQSRADAVKKYLVGKGVGEDRLIATGYGSDKPVADNKTVAGKAKNRRVELHLKYY